MSIKLPNYTIQEKIAPPSFFKKTLLPLLILISFFIGYFTNRYYADDFNKSLRVRNTILEDTNNDNKDKISQQQAQISLLNIDKKIKYEAVIQVQNDFKDLIDKQNKLKAEIKFYEKLLSPNAENKKLRVFGAHLTRQNNKFDLKVTLAQKIERTNIVSGKYKIYVTGTLENKQKTIQINTGDTSNFKFKYFHHITLMFSLPIGFNAEQLVVKLFPRNKKIKTVKYTVNWQSLTIRN